ncbi:MAG: protein phosphatase 2C domain-containing protein [Planctomycetia bacterium]|nr:protein phosphatase 2C domain-containing protein [Planctomycetia bacterium]
MGSGTSLDCCELTDIGRRRASNQDSNVVLAPWSADQYRRRGWLLVVADGMGAHAAGEMASALAVEHVPLVYEKLAARSPPRALDAAIRQAHAVIHERGENAADLKGMGTTCTALALVPRGALVGHVGDSRAYRVRGGRIDQLSRDHSLSWELAGQRTAGSDEPVPKNIITRSVGPQPKVDVDVEGPFPVEARDVFVLCTDGLSGQVADEEIGLLAGGLAPDAAAAALVGLTLVRGAPDNVTVIVARAGEKEASQVAPGDQPWPLTDETVTAKPQPIPVKLLSGAAVSLLTALVFNPWSGLMGADGIGGLLGDELAFPVALILSITMALLFIGCLLAAVLSSFASSAGPVRVLPVGAKLGGGPYRTYDCTPSAPLLEGIVASVESAAHGLSTQERDRLLAAVSAARSRITAGDLPAALTAAAEAIAGYRRSIDAARGDDTAHG